MKFLILILFISSCYPRRFEDNRIHGGKHSFKEVVVKDTLISFHKSRPREATMLLFFCDKNDCNAKDIFYLYKN
jgi:hypothetical protein